MKWEYNISILYMAISLTSVQKYIFIEVIPAYIHLKFVQFITSSTSQ